MQDFWRDIAADIASGLEAGGQAQRRLAAYLRVLAAEAASPFDGLPPQEALWEDKQRDSLAPWAVAFAANPARGEGVSNTYLPLESFRGPLAENLPEPSLHRYFLSSGTTQASRSRSPFSPAGLALYEAASTLSFFYIIEELFGVHPYAVPGISLVPDTQTWPDSSLAQMIAWIGQKADVCYCSEDNFQEAVQDFAGTPLWVFGTAFHFINLIDAEKASPLPAGSIVIETGGTKGRSRELSRAELFRLLQERFLISDEDIVSEYGMCELASQAYDWKFRRQLERVETKRRFRFPAWVRCDVLSGPARLGHTSEGMLVIDDPMRIDVPLPVRTEDLASIDAHGFRLLGRAKGAPLKGCSLAAEIEKTAYQGAYLLGEPALRNTVPTANPTVDAPLPTIRLVEDELRRRSRIFSEAFHRFLDDSAVCESLAQELRSGQAAGSALADLRRSMPSDAGDWVTAVHQAVGTSASGESALPARWLFILPQNHGLVGCYPLAFAYMAGLSVTVRVPSVFRESSSFLSRFIEMYARLPQADIQRREADFIVNSPTSLPGIDAILCYGSDDTIAAIRAQVNDIPVVGFGDRVGVSLFSEAKLTCSAPLLMRDTLSLGQQGCMSTRLAFMHAHSIDERLLDKTARHLQNEALRFWAAPLNREALVGQEIEACRLRRLGCRVFVPHSNHEPVIAFARPADIARLTPEQLASYAAMHAFVLPVILTSLDRDDETFVKLTLQLLERSASFKNVTCEASWLQSYKLRSLAKSNYRSLNLSPLGDGNVPAWNGQHEGLPLFQPTDLSRNS